VDQSLDAGVAFGHEDSRVRYIVRWIKVHRLEMVHGVYVQSEVRLWTDEDVLRDRVELFGIVVRDILVFGAAREYSLRERLFDRGGGCIL